MRPKCAADILIAVTDGLKGIGEALGAVFPATTLQTCIVHLIRNSLDFASWKDRKQLAAALKPIYTAVSAETAAAELDAFEASAWGVKFATVVAAWRRTWDRVIPFFAFPPEVRRVIYTTNAIESIHARLRKIIKRVMKSETSGLAIKARTTLTIRTPRAARALPARLQPLHRPGTTPLPLMAPGTSLAKWAGSSAADVYETKADFGPPFCLWTVASKKEVFLAACLREIACTRSTPLATSGWTVRRPAASRKTMGTQLPFGLRAGHCHGGNLHSHDTR